MEMEIEMVIATVISILTIVIFIILMHADNNYKGLSDSINNIESLVSKANSNDLMSILKVEISELDKKISFAHKKNGELLSCIEELTEETKLIDFGFNPLNFELNDNEEFKHMLKKVYKEQENLIINNKGMLAYSTFTVHGSETLGVKQGNKTKKLLLRALNNEFDVIRKKMKMKSFSVAINKLDKLVEQIDRLGEVDSISVDYSYVKSKRIELDIWHTELKRRDKEKENIKKQQQILREQKNKANINFDLDTVQDQIDEKEVQIQNARLLVTNALKDERDALEKLMASQKKQLDVLKNKHSRAISQAQITRAGYIYVISNHGCFGKDIVKIGMTRRLIPSDRVVELGDASVPFRFDTHTMAFVEDAPIVEKQLHRIFSAFRVNTGNHRKEFFRVSLEAVQNAMEELGVKANWQFDVEAMEYRESVIIRKTKKEKENELLLSEISFPSEV